MGNKKSIAVKPAGRSNSLKKHGVGSMFFDGNIHSLFKGEFFGEDAILKLSGSLFTYTAVGPVQCLSIPADKFKALIASKVTLPCF